MIKRHAIDEKVLSFIMDSFQENNNLGESTSTYESTKNNLVISIWKHNLIRGEKVRVFFHKISNNVTRLEKDYELSLEFSKILIQFFEELEDKNNQDYIRNSHKEILNLIDE